MDHCEAPVTPEGWQQATARRHGNRLDAVRLLLCCPLFPALNWHYLTRHTRIFRMRGPNTVGMVLFAVSVVSLRLVCVRRLCPLPDLRVARIS